MITVYYRGNRISQLDKKEFRFYLIDEESEEVFESKSYESLMDAQQAMDKVLDDNPNYKRED